MHLAKRGAIYQRANKCIFKCDMNNINNILYKYIINIHIV